ncbi:Signal recognition particle, SRP19 subunit [Carpediemonas membranifera]|uniref:Signal recognition particle, SRP19 subunit n=1 Tax=Carpediemonas membranifera TaxID=201153 RepID=A0A8J6B108_9EUKA|nr:Signal recognition particle, SRP19 subunit [Carpediemonas membranifera]|eukprot:KAG9391969.1 Signal recognition particle, SRP19 subunit [Carpediemonas membranifera]
MAEEYARWRVLWPINFDVTRTSRYRIVSKGKAVQNPDYNLLLDGVKKTGVKFHEESNKRHPADFFTSGRIRFSLEGNESFSSKLQFYFAVADAMKAIQTQRAEAAAAAAAAARKGQPQAKGKGQGKKVASNKPKKPRKRR